MLSVDDTATGRFLVRTASGSGYLLDLDRRVISRTTSPGHVNQRLRRDGETISLVEILRCELGKPMLLLLDLELPNIIVTSRKSTTVVRIDALPSTTIRP